MLYAGLANGTVVTINLKVRNVAYHNMHKAVKTLHSNIAITVRLILIFYLGCCVLLEGLEKLQKLYINKNWIMVHLNLFIFFPQTVHVLFVVVPFKEENQFQIVVEVVLYEDCDLQQPHNKKSI